ncbi:hypothetical protein [Phenylobacterium sp. J367]|uniref:hypothetical protein n=1 Tax=Phenylobacterium sp. J367 TaxID=2898435 RepID=UPI002151CBB2|nr:hypothetical protein [Phenylobacterium sp. J367]MCR5879442.1 hypothetical protein [Phenylobacterium sp. J367]
MLVGLTNDLSSVGRRPPGGQRGARLFTRLNVARSVREAEHQDLAARHPTAEAGPDAGA